MRGEMFVTRPPSLATVGRIGSVCRSQFRKLDAEKTEDVSNRDDTDRMIVIVNYRKMAVTSQVHRMESVTDRIVLAPVSYTHLTLPTLLLV